MSKTYSLDDGKCEVKIDVRRTAEDREEIVLESMIFYGDERVANLNAGEMVEASPTKALFHALNEIDELNRLLQPFLYPVDRQHRNTLITQGFDDIGKRVVVCLTDSYEPQREHSIMSGALEYHRAEKRGVTIPDEAIIKLIRDGKQTLSVHHGAGPEETEPTLLEMQIDGLLEGHGSSEDHENVTKAFKFLGLRPEFIKTKLAPALSHGYTRMAFLNSCQTIGPDGQELRPNWKWREPSSPKPIESVRRLEEGRQPSDGEW